uniref:Palmitoyltransferase n=1 Tax=Panagrellus redivivus TaxID=6233 RepID=A0A7E4VSM5_PANRE
MEPSNVEYEEAGTSASEFDELDIKQAVQFGDLSKVKHLVESGLATINDTDADDCSLLHWAAINNRMEVAKYLIDNNCSINHVGGVLGCTPLHWACRQGHTRMVALLVKHNADYNKSDGEGFTALHTACQAGRTPIACYLIAKGQSPDVRDNSGMTPLMYAAIRTVGRDPMQMLVTMGADINAVDSVFGHTALHFAVIHGNHTAIMNLIRLKADISITNKANETPLDIAQRKHDYLSMRLLENAEREVGIRRYTWKQRYEDRNVRNQIASILPALFFVVPGIIMTSKFDITFKFFSIFLVYGLLGFLTKKLVLGQSTTGFTFGFAVFAKAFFFLVWLIHLHQSAGWYLQIIFFVILVLLPYLYYLLRVRDPGTIVVNHANRCRQVVDMTEGDYFSGNFCSTCLIVRPLRSKHCRVCDKCIKRFDHHCVWLDKCIGLENHRLFFGYLVTLFISAIVMITGCVSFFSQNCGGLTFQTFASCQLWVSYTLVLAVIIFFWLCVLLFMQCSGIAHAMTTNERLNAYRYEHLTPNCNDQESSNSLLRDYVLNFYYFFFDDEIPMPNTQKKHKFPIV